MSVKKRLVPSHAINKSWKLSATDLALKNKYASFALAYNGKLNINKIIYALKKALEAYDFFYGKLNKYEDELLCRCFNDKDVDNYFSPVLLEIDVKNIDFEANRKISCFKNKLISSLTPDKPSEKKEHSSLVQIKLTNFNNFGVIGIRWNHVLSDFKGIFNFIQYISKLYNDQDITEIDIPIFDRDLIKQRIYKDIKFNNKIVSKSGRNNIVIISRAMAIWSSVKYIYNAFLNYIPVSLMLNEEKIDDIKKLVFENKGIKISTNDLINATLLKFIAECARSSSANIGLYYPINIRNLLGISDQFVGNCLGNVSELFKAEDLRNLEIIEIAIRNRLTLNEYNIHHISKDFQWADYWREKGIVKSVYHHWFFGQNRVYSSNWSSFGIENIHFGESTFHCLLRSAQLNRFLVLPAFHTTILPYSDNNKTQRMLRMSIHKKHLNLLKELSGKFSHVQEIAVL